MRIYLDDDSIETLLVQLLSRAGHDVVTSVAAGLGGRPDPVHLLYAIRDRRRLLTHNDRDFRLLHELVFGSGGHHPGILIVRSDNDRTRDLTPRGIALAIAKLEASGITLDDDVAVLNHWR
jgi:predicted nuclease of predicted toxin-antitoxin system